MLAMYLAYRVFLASENQHAYNRGILLLIYVVAFTAIPVQGLMPPAQQQQAVTIEGIERVNAVATPSSTHVWGTVVIWIFMAGVAVTTFKTIVVWYKLTGIIRRGERTELNGYPLVITDDERFAPLSWMNYIIISQKDYDDNFSAIATHELKHVACRHWIDLLIAQIVCIINWFNPAAWLMRDELMLVHEYQADMAVIDSGVNPQQYQLLLIKKAVGSRFPSLANSLNHSKLKKRITMMYQKRSDAGRRFKALALVPMLALALGAVSVPAVRAAVSTISSSEVSVGKSNEKPAVGKTGVQVFKVTNLNNNGNKTTVTINGEGLGDNVTVSGGTFTTNGKTYQADGLKFYLTDGVADIVATFPFIDEFDKSSMTIVVNGEKIPFDLEEFFNKSADVIKHPEVMPEYPGGNAAMMQAIMSKVTFPDPERPWKEGASGLTLVGFTVMPDGTISDLNRELSCGYGDLDQIAIDAVKNGLTEKWKPGTVGGKPVAVSYRIPIRFKSK